MPQRSAKAQQEILEQRLQVFAVFLVFLAIITILSLTFSALKNPRPGSLSSYTQDRP